VIGLVALDLAGLAAPSGRMLMLLCAPVAAGLALALAASLRAAGPGRGRWPASEGTGQAPDPVRAGAGTRNSARGGPGKVTGGAPVPGTGDTLDHG
jgi:hypothetical protein